MEFLKIETNHKGKKHRNQFFFFFTVNERKVKEIKNDTEIFCLKINSSFYLFLLFFSCVIIIAIILFLRQLFTKRHRNRRNSSSLTRRRCHLHLPSCRLQTRRADDSDSKLASIHALSVRDCWNALIFADFGKHH